MSFAAHLCLVAFLCRAAARATQMLAAEFLRRVFDRLPYKVHTVRTDNSVQLTPQAHQFLSSGHNFDRICQEYDW
ncbi:hypothetical protein GCM10023186_10120 [Hymenobacter koreensis]|uniref:Integrase catalytic domain-containing protein n=1 Tax=Hymenobacter koreensis TaxID=1084523 RepID=A0ABP8IWI6_9BACT